MILFIISIIYPFINLPVYLDNIGINLPAITFETMGYEGRPISKTADYKLFSNYDLSPDISIVVSTAYTRCWLLMVFQLRRDWIRH